MKRRDFAILVATALLASRRARAVRPIPVTLYKKPACDCCEGYARYLDGNGFRVDVRQTGRLAEISRTAGIPADLEGCHTSFIGNYVIGGHVPAETLRKLLNAKPAIVGITLPGMPTGSPGMYGNKTGPSVVYAISRDGTPPRVFAVD